jgi:hypothetical protein
MGPAHCDEEVTDLARTLRTHARQVGSWVRLSLLRLNALEGELRRAARASFLDDAWPLVRQLEHMTRTGAFLRRSGLNLEQLEAEVASLRGLLEEVGAEEFSAN